MESTRHRELICGDFPDLEAAFIERMHELRRADTLAPLIVLVPTNLLRRHLSQTLADRGVPHLNVRFLTIDAFVRELVTPRMLADGLVPMPSFADELLMARSCSGHDDRFYFAKLSDRPGLHRSLLGSIQDLKEAGADLSTFQSALHKLNGLHPSARSKLESLLTVWQRYELMKQEHQFLDDSDQHVLAAQLIADGAELPGTAAFLVYGIYDFKRIQAGLVWAVAEKLPTTVFFPFEPQFAWEYARPSLEMLVQVGFTWTSLVRSAELRSAWLERLCARLFTNREMTESSAPLTGERRSVMSNAAQLPSSASSRALGPAPPTAGAVGGSAAGAVSAQNVRSPMRFPVEIVSVPGETREAVEMPRIILDLARLDGMHFGEVAVLLRSRGAAERMFREAFDEAGLPVQCPNGVPLRESRAGRAVLLMLQVLNQDFARRDVMELMTFADFDFESLAGLNDPPVTQWDALTMRAGIVRGRDQWQRRLASLQGRIIRANETAHADKATPESRDSTVDPSTPSTVASLIQATKRLFVQLETIASAGTWGELVDRLAAAFRILIRPSVERGRVLNTIMDLRRLDVLSLGCDLALLARLVDEALRVEVAEQVQSDMVGTTLVPLMQARGVPFRAVIVPGMIERSFPQAPSVDPILLDHERRQLNAIFAAAGDASAVRHTAGARGHPVEVSTLGEPVAPLAPHLPLKADQVAEERLLFRLAVGAARERLILTFPRIEAESGRARVPSYFLLRTIEALGPSVDVSTTDSRHQIPAMSPSSAPREESGENVTGVGLMAPQGTVTRSASAGSASRRRRMPSADQMLFPFLRSDRDVVANPSRLEPVPWAPPPTRTNESHGPPDTNADAAPSDRGGGSFAAAPERGGGVQSFDVSCRASQEPAGTDALARWPCFRHVALSEFAPAPSRAVSLFEHDLGTALAAVRSPAGQPAMLGAFASISPHFSRGVAAECVRWGQRTFTRYDGRVEDAELLAMLRGQSPLLSSISPSRIEDYARCPFHFSMHNLLGLEALDEPEQLARSDPEAKGKLVHAILADFLRTMKQQGLLPLAASCAADLLEIARKHLREFEESGAAGPGLTWKVERDQLMKFFEQFIAREIQRQNELGLRPAHFEMPFGRHDVPEGLSSDPAKFDLGNGQVLHFHGIIDRVDISHDGKRLYVIDYKGRHLPNPGREGFGQGRVVQLPIYLMGAQTALLPHGQFDAAGGEYLSYQPDVDPVSIPPLDEESSERLREILRTIAEGIHAGLFMQFTGHDACQYCPYDRVCMGIQDKTSELKQCDPAAAEYLEMKGRFNLSVNEPAQ